jgi:tetratricopeptide (TPR) repeat protein
MAEKSSVPIWKRFLYTIVLLVTTVAVLESVLAAAGCWVFRPFRPVTVPDGAQSYQYLNPRVRVRVPKPPGVVRIAVLGESAVVGYPFEGAGFPEHLGGLLAGPAAGATVYEVINLSVSGVNTDFIRKIMPDVLAAVGPDLVIIYAGNNELLAHDRIDDLSQPRLKAAVWWLRGHSRLWNAPQYFVGLVFSRGLATRLLLTIAHRPDEQGRWLNPPPVRAHLLAVYLHHLHQIVAAGRAANVPVVLCAPGMNLRDWVPMKAVHGPQLDARTLAENAAALDRARAQMLAGQAEVAIPSLRAITVADPQYAKGWFFLGRAEVLAGHTTQGIADLETAVDHSDFFQETPPSWGREIQRLAARTATPFIDVDGALRRTVADGAPGFDTFFDGCHPRLHTNYLIATILVRDLARQGLLPPALADADLPAEGKVLDALLPDRFDVQKNYFNQAMVLGFLYDYREYQLASITCLDQAMEFGLSPGIAATYQGYFLLSLGRPQDAAAAFSRARRSDPAFFSETIKKKLPRVIRNDGSRLCVRVAEGDEHFYLYPIADLAPSEQIPPVTCTFEFDWDGQNYRPAGD